MKIEAINTYLMQAGPPAETAWSAPTGSARGGMSMGATRHWLFVEVVCDDGTVGTGEGSGWPKVVETAVLDLAPLLIGEDPRDTERLWQKLHLATMSHGIVGTVGGGAVGALDMALWDIKGKALGTPVWNLLGGKVRHTVPAYAHASTPDRALEIKAMGYRAFKTGNVKGTVEKVAALRQALGDDVDLMVDLHGPPWLTLADAKRMARALEQFNLLFLEEPLPPENLDGYAELRAATDLPIAAGERHTGNLWSAAPLLKQGLVDVIQPDTGRGGGLTHLRKIAAMAEASFVTVAPHAGTLGPVAEFAALHLMSAIPNALVLERFAVDWEGRDTVVTAVPELRDGGLVVPDEPGFGVSLNHEAIAAYPAQYNASVPKGDAYAARTQDEHAYVQARWSRATAFGKEGG
ncbi:MAG: mandelate racemase/muconate lactonizing enzyme family protein [Hyphomicrobiales bacterium]